MMLNLCATPEGRGRKKESWEKRDGEETVMIFRHEEPRSSRRVGERADGLAGWLAR
jgi:hypothetical protein